MDRLQVFKYGGLKQCMIKDSKAVKGIKSGGWGNMLRWAKLVSEWGYRWGGGGFQIMY